MDFNIWLTTYSIKNPWYFFVPAGLFVAYVAYLMVSGRRDERSGRNDGGREL